jgi:hypothetical protein
MTQADFVLPGLAAEDLFGERHIARDGGGRQGFLQKGGVELELLEVALGWPWEHGTAPTGWLGLFSFTVVTVSAIQFSQRGDRVVGHGVILQ